MRNIAKGAEPRSLETHRCSTSANYDNFGTAEKQALRKLLVAEQRGLCCYCLRRIVADPAKMKIEHWQNQGNYPEQQLDYSNLLAVCLGGEGSREKLQHCDTRKGERDLSMNPADPTHDVELAIRYLSDGSISSRDPKLKSELETVLNLNKAPWLKANRKAVLDGFLDSKPKQGDWNNKQIESWLAEWNGEKDNDDLKEYCQVVIYWLRKRLKQT